MKEAGIASVLQVLNNGNWLKSITMCWKRKYFGHVKHHRGLETAAMEGNANSWNKRQGLDSSQMDIEK